MQNGHLQVVKVLLKKGANPDQSTLFGKTPLALAARVSALSCIAMSAVHCSPTMLLTGIMQEGHAEVVQVLLEQGATLDKPEGNTLLAWAAKVSA